MANKVDPKNDVCPDVKVGAYHKTNKHLDSTWNWFAIPKLQYGDAFVRMKKYVKGNTYKTTLKYCPKCKHPWSITPNSSGMDKYFDFPTYGLKRVVCKYCKNSN